MSIEFLWLNLLQAAGKGGGSALPGACGGNLASLGPIILMFVVFYFLLIRPQQKKAREHRAMLSNLQRGEQVVTNGGLVGRVTGLTDRYLTLEVAEKIRLRVLRTHILGKVEQLETEPARAPQ